MLSTDLIAAHVHSVVLCNLQPPYLVNSSSPWLTPTYQPPARYFHSPGAPPPAGAFDPARQASPAAAAAYAAAWQQQQVCAVLSPAAASMKGVMD